MYLSFKRLALIFLALFAVLVAGAFLFDFFWRAPGERCEANGGWYDIEKRICGTPIYIPDITRRAPGESREDASRRQAVELADQERRVAAAEAARQAAIREERERLREATRD